MNVEADQIRPGDLIDSVAVAVVFPGSPRNYTTLVMADHSLKHYRPADLVEVQR